MVSSIQYVIASAQLCAVAISQYAIEIASALPRLAMTDIVNYI